MPFAQINDFFLTWYFDRGLFARPEDVQKIAELCLTAMDRPFGYLYRNHGASDLL